VLDEVEAAIITLGALELYQRGGKLVQPLKSEFKTCGDREYKGWQLLDVTRQSLQTQLNYVAQFWQYDKRSKKFVVVNPPFDVADAYLHRQRAWKLPRIAGIANAPFLHADGTIHDWEGYDPVSGLICKDIQAFPSVPRSPDKAEAAAALAELKKPLAEFPFVTGADQAAALSAMLTAIDRRGMDIAPLHAFTAPTAGTGKGLLIAIIAALATGERVGPIDQSRQPDEFTKCFGAELLAGTGIILIDNCENILEGSLLNIAVTERVFKVRVLGMSQNNPIPNNAMILVNGNNLAIGADMTRRVILCQMDAQMERPETREFKDDQLFETVKANRAQLVVAALTVLRGWHIARATAGIKLKPCDFTEWSHRVREALVWLGEDDPAATMEQARKDDPYRAERAAVFTEWHKALGENPTLVKDIIAAAFNYPDFYAALVTVAVARNGKEISLERLGRWLSKNKGSIVNDLSLISAGGIAGGYPLWRIRKF
jgi:putative DNA primase/helicase